MNVPPSWFTRPWPTNDSYCDPNKTPNNNKNNIVTSAGYSTQYNNNNAVFCTTCDVYTPQSWWLS